MVKRYISSKIGFQESENLNISVYFNHSEIEIFQLKQDFIDFLEEEGKPKNDIVQVLYCSQNLILCICKNFNKKHNRKGAVPIIHSFSIKNSKFHDTFQLSCTKLLQHSKQSSYCMLKNILNNFDWQ